MISALCPNFAQTVGAQAQAEEDQKPSSEQTDSADDTKVSESKSSARTRSSQGDQDHRSEGNHTVPDTPTQSGLEDSSQQQQESSDASVVRDIVHSIMTKAAAEAKGAAAETKEAEKLAASAAKSPKTKSP